MLKDRKFRITRQRQLILEEIKKTDSHPTADQLYQRVRRRLPRISLGTIYRNLEILSEKGLIQKLELGGTQRRYDSEARNHYHIRCIYCDEVKDMPIKPLTDFDKIFSNISDYQILGHRLEFLGICPRCNKKRKKSNKKQQ